MTTVSLDNNSRTGHKLRDITKSPRQRLTSSLVHEEELISLEEFKQHFENRIYERLGLKITL